MYPPPIDPSNNPDIILDRIWLMFSLVATPFDGNSPTLIPLLFLFDDTHHRLSRETKPHPTKFLNNLIYKSTVPLLCETYSQDLYITPSIREHEETYIFT